MATDGRQSGDRRADWLLPQPARNLACKGLNGDTTTRLLTVSRLGHGSTALVAYAAVTRHPSAARLELRLCICGGRVAPSRTCEAKCGWAVLGCMAGRQVPAAPRLECGHVVWLHMPGAPRGMVVVVVVADEGGAPGSNEMRSETSVVVYLRSKVKGVKSTLKRSRASNVISAFL